MSCNPPYYLSPLKDCVLDCQHENKLTINNEFSRECTYITQIDDTISDINALIGKNIVYKYTDPDTSIEEIKLLHIACLINDSDEACE